MAWSADFLSRPIGAMPLRGIAPYERCILSAAGIAVTARSMGIELKRQSTL
jgi:hypothetical protein